MAVEVSEILISADPDVGRPSGYVCSRTQIARFGAVPAGRFGCQVADHIGEYGVAARSSVGSALPGRLRTAVSVSRRLLCALVAIQRLQPGGLA